MFWLFAEAGEVAAESSEPVTHHLPAIVEFVNRYLGEPVYHFQLKYTRPLWVKFFALFNTTPESAWGVPYTPETAIPWATTMFMIACLLSIGLIWVLKGKLSADDPHGGQQTLEASVLGIRSLLVDVVGEHGVKYFPVVMTFATLILVSNLMGFIPGFLPPSAATNVTFALGLSSFLYYNYIGISENGIVRHLRHFAGPIWWIAPLIFFIEIVGNLIRPFSLGLRLFGNMFADEQVVETIANLKPGVTNWILPVVIMPLGLFVCFVQTFVFSLLSMIYLSEVTHASHDDEHGAHAHEEHGASEVEAELPAPA